MSENSEEASLESNHQLLKSLSLMISWVVSRFFPLCSFLDALCFLDLLFCLELEEEKSELLSKDRLELLGSDRSERSRLGMAADLC